MRRVLAALLLPVFAAAAVEAATISGLVSDSTGGALIDARVVLRDIATGQEQEVATSSDGRYRFEAPAAGTYLLIIRRQGFAEAARTIVVENGEDHVELAVTLEIGPLNAEVTVTAARGDREQRHVPLHIEALTSGAIEQMNTVSTGDAIASAVNVTPVGNGPFGVRPRLRGLDSTRVLVLVDGERLNTARMATDRTGADVGLISPDVIDRIEIVNGAGTLMYGSDALAGTINIITTEPSFTSKTELVYGFRGLSSSNENGLRGTATLGVTSPRVTIRVQGGAERYDNYRAGNLGVEDTRDFFTSGQIDRKDTVDDAFGFTFGAFADPFNAPYARTDNTVRNSQARGDFLNAAARVKLAERRSVRVRYQRRRMSDVGFPDFAQPYFFNATSLPYSNLDKLSAHYQAQAVTSWLANLSLTGYYQRQERLLQNLLPVQFPAPTPVAFFPISVMRLDVLSRTEQRVWTPGVDLQAVLVPAKRHLLTTGLTFYQDRSSDQRTTETTTSMVGQVLMGARGPAPVLFPSPVRLGPASIAHPVRVPDARFRDLAVFAQNEWRLRPEVSIVAGLRGDFYAVTVEATPGYDVAPVIAGARPVIDPATLPNANGADYTRNALTGDLGLVVNPDGRVTPFIRFGRSYRHPNLEEMLFAGPATAGSIAPNIEVKPEKGNNFDAGATFRLANLSGGAHVFFNRYEDFIAQDLVVATTTSGPLAQATNFADVHITGIELSAGAPMTLRRGVLTLSGGAAFMRGTIAQGINPLTGSALDGTPADNITPVKATLNVRFMHGGGLWWAEYGIRTQTRVSRVAETVLDSPFLIAQDLLSLDGFTVQRVGWGLNLTRGRERANVVFAVENLTDRYYREQFQFAPSRGRSFTVGLNIGAF
jgi:hemoglobin/transferrin/lactoferrin receptor protein